ncbi:MarR family winged helix-turn-helix transcriptional regulator [Kineosporia sp. NBRC 101731]|uniref:MarR family winged helix-turn-helix transcriptional regulator n=1 Tax=Kineosporia sp. NBRC 101731 TaxID=3032199 RepID=UPI0024A405A9|nr:MarR family winged helix-turn-helix transcriptional regulator [Kineosporia sp. NBRC 101731]GLY32450.1 MarR family transcriptional regulator [Kineosporia sp. NBRC 101731]
MTSSLQDVGLAVKRLQWRHHREANTRLAALGLSLAQWDVLRHLHDQPEASLHTLALLTFQTDQSMGSLATRMIDRGLLRRLSGPGRAVRHEITDAGADLREKGSGILDDVLEETVGQLSDRERATLEKLLRKATPDAY